MNYGSLLSEASGEGHVDIVQLLLSTDADLDRRRPLGSASRSGHREGFKRLRAAGADVDIGNPLSYACGNGYTESSYIF